MTDQGMTDQTAQDQTALTGYDEKPNTSVGWPLIQTQRFGNILVTLLQDEAMGSPRDWYDNGTIILAWHRNAYIGDGERWSKNKGWNLDSPEHAREIFGEGFRTCRHCDAGLDESGHSDEDCTAGNTHDRKTVGDILGEMAGSPVIACQPLYLYEHSGMTVSTSNARYPFTDQWDAGQVGWVFVTEESRKVTGTADEYLSELIAGDVETLDHYLRGNVYAYSIERLSVCDHGDVHSETLESVGGFIGEYSYAWWEALEDAKGRGAEIPDAVTTEAREDYYRDNPDARPGVQGVTS